MRPIQALLAAVLQAALAPTQEPAREPTAEPTAAAFDAGLDEVHAAMRKAQWPAARERLLALLHAHEKQPYVLAQKDALVHDLTTCRFYEQAVVPPIGDLLRGSVEQWSPDTGRIRVAYDREFSDWQGDDLLVHPLVFAGDYSVRVSGPFYAADERTVRVFFDLAPNGQDWYFADFGYADRTGGRGLPVCVGQGRWEDQRLLAQDTSTVRTQKAFDLELRITEKQVELRSEGKSLLKAKRKDATLGRVGFSPGSVEKVVLEGKVEPSWYQGRVDAALAEQRAEFEAKYVARVELPEWMFDAPSAVRTQAKEKGWIAGDEVYFSEAMDATVELWAAGKVYEAWEALRKLGNDDAQPVSLSFVEVGILLDVGRPEQALPVSEQIVADAPESGLVRMQHGRVLEALGRRDDALVAMRAALALDPGSPRAYESLALTLLRLGRRDEAARIVRAGKVEHGLWAELEALDSMLAMAERGPAFQRRFTATSTHYEVVSDIDQKLCQEACRMLETSYTNLKAQFGARYDDKDAERFRVFVFSGESGYQDYSRAILGAPMPHTAGLYSPELKQLLIWNLPKKADMERTIVHEGFHQFLDRLMHDPPSWFNEGTAEYWETARREKARYTGGQVRRDHIATLARSQKALPSLKNLVYGSRADFYANATLRYAHAWAFVHFLREGGREPKQRYDALWQALRGEGSRRKALDQAFAGVDWDAFERDFWLHVRKING